MASTRRRIDQLLVDRGLAESRHKAQALLLAGQVLVNEQTVEKSGRLVDPDASIRILSEMPFVSRAGAKLQAALDSFGITVAGRVCADLGASTGGFTDCLLQNGAAVVHAYDVGAGQLAWKLKSDPRVVIHERCNVRYLEAQDLPDQISFLAADLSFISLTKVLLPLKDALQSKMAERTRGLEGACVDLIVLVKPQFEVGKGQVGKGGIVRDSAKQRGTVIGIRKFAADAGFDVRADFPSPVSGAKGNREFLLHLRFVPV